MCGPPKVNARVLLKPRKKTPVKNKNTMDFRRADPMYVNFIPTTCIDAIDLFNRHRNLGLTAELYPECFVHCARKLTNTELDKFHRFIICPDGDIEKGGEKPTMLDRQLDEERRQLEKEAVRRDETPPSSIPDDDVSMESPTEPMSQDDEKAEYVNINLP